MLLLFIAYNYICGLEKSVKRSYFLKMALYALGHAVFCLITLLTVNSASVAVLINNILYVISYLFWLLFVFEFFNWVISNVCEFKDIKVYVRLASSVPLYVFLILSVALDIGYAQADGVYYSYGPTVYAAYAAFALYCLGTAAVMIILRKRFKKHFALFVFPVLAVMLITAAIQLLVPQILCSAGVLTVITAAVFISANSVFNLRQQAFTDGNTGVRNRNAYSMDFAELSAACLTDPSANDVTIVICDLNDLKLVNDTFGHAMGDVFIKRQAIALTEGLKSCKGRVYRIGGDEFAAIYLNVPEETVKEEIEAVRLKCEELSQDLPTDLIMAIGYATTDGGSLLSSVELYADQEMYKQKVAFKKLHPVRKFKPKGTYKNV